MLWILQDEATFEALAGTDPSKSVMLKVIGAGMAFEIMSLFDGQARSLRGIANTLRPVEQCPIAGVASSASAGWRQTDGSDLLELLAVPARVDHQVQVPRPAEQRAACCADSRGDESLQFEKLL